MATTDLSHRIQAALIEALSGAGYRLVTQVEVRQGWGDIFIVTVHTALSQADASPGLQRTIQELVATVLDGRRHYVEIRWTGS